MDLEGGEEKIEEGGVEYKRRWKTQIDSKQEENNSRSKYLLNFLLCDLLCIIILVCLMFKNKIYSHDVYSQIKCV